MTTPAFEIASRVVGSRGAGQDRAWFEATGETALVVLADGAGGMGGGARAAELCVELASTRLLEGDAAVELLHAIDAEVHRDRDAGETTVVVARVSADQVDGASIGDSGAWLVPADGIQDLTADQTRKPMLGSGASRATPFRAALGAATLLVASDGLLKYAPRSVIRDAIVGTDDLEAAADALVDAVRLRSGALQDDVSIVLLRSRR
jgi:serine/threonine protein phosphatase PrpC